MKSRFIRRRNLFRRGRENEAGVTIILVALSMVGILAMAVLSIDVITLYLARLEAQRAADAAALAAARIISLSGVTGDPDNTAVGTPSVSPWPAVCTTASASATQVAQAVGNQNVVAGIAASTVTVTFKLSDGTTADCSSPSASFAINPQVQVQVQRTGLPTFFARIWGGPSNTVTASATAEVYNPSNSASVSAGKNIIPVQPRCVKPWVVPNIDPWNPTPNPAYCNQTGGPGVCRSLVNSSDGSIMNKGISLSGSANTGVIGESFILVADCPLGSSCSPLLDPTPVANKSASGSGNIPAAPFLEYLPGQVLNSSIALATGGDTCADAASNYAEAIRGCDQSTTYYCGGVSGGPGNTIDLSENPRFSGDTTNGGRCLIHQVGGGPGQDILTTTAFPFTITAEGDYPIAALKDNFVTNSSSVVSLPIYDSSAPFTVAGTTASVTIVGFLQVFINQVDGNGNVQVTVLNVAGCSNGLGADSVGTAVAGSSPVPVRLITPP